MAGRTKTYLKRALLGCHEKVGRWLGADDSGQLAATRIRQQEELLAYFTEGVHYTQSFDFAGFRDQTLQFIASLQVGDSRSFRYAHSCAQPNIYATTFSLLTQKLLGVDVANDASRWRSALDGYQSSDDGLFWDPVLSNQLYEQADWWGARHFALLAANAYDAMEQRPNHPFHFLREFCGEDAIKQLVTGTDWSEGSDDDNKLMNIGCLLQFARDRWQDSQSQLSVELMKESLRGLNSPRTGLWHEDLSDSPAKRSRAVQFAFHLYPIFLYDREEFPYPEPLIDTVLATQNPWGGFAPHAHSTACEDIDSLHLLVVAAEQTDYRKEDIVNAVNRFLLWVFANRNPDGGFVFSRASDFVYGHEQMSSRANESHLFGTWFRSLSIALAHRCLHPAENPFKLHRSPGYYF